MWIVADRVRETSVTTGAGDISLAGAVSNFKAFSAVCADQDTIFYAIVHQTLAEWEVGYGTYNSGANSLTRAKVLASSNSDAVVTFSAGTKDVFVDLAAMQGAQGPVRNLVSGGDVVVPENSTLYIAGTCEIAAGKTLEIRAGAVLEIG